MSAKRLMLSVVFGMFCLTSAQAQVKVGVVTSSTGPVALVGIPQKNTVALLPTTAGGKTIEYISLDDSSDPSAAVSAFRKLINEDKVDAIIGPSGTASAVAALGFAAEAGVPMLAPVGSTAVILPMDDKKKWVFKTTQNDEIVSAALVKQMVKDGVKTVGFVGPTDPFGDNWLKVFSADAQKAGIKIVATERFQRQDTSFTAQGLKILSSRPDAVLIAAPGSSSVMPQTTLYDLGYRGKYYQTHGAALSDYLRLGGKKVEGTTVAGSIMLVMDQASDANPSKKVAAEYMGAYEKKYGTKPATFGANVYDAGLLLEQAIPVALKAGAPGTPAFRTALRDALEQVKNVPGAQGIYNLSPTDHSGFDERGIELLTVKNGQWAPLN